MKRAQRQAQQMAALEQFKQRLESVGYLEKLKRSNELWNSDREGGWYAAYHALQSCKRNDLVFEAVEAGATKVGVAKLIGLTAGGVATVVTKIAAARYFQMMRQKKAGRKPRRKL